MNTQIPPKVIEDIKYRNDIEDVISSYITLKRAGSNMNGLCPFHNEKTPSFTVFTSTQSFHCFGCGAGGDVISFIMRMENLEYIPTIEFLAKRCGISIPEMDRTNDVGVKRSRIIEMNKDAAKFYRDMLFDEQTGAIAREYLTNRGLSTAIIKRFGLGYSPPQFDVLRKHLASKGYSQEEMNVGFLCAVSKNNGSSYDYFRGRLMFPIIDTSGNVVAFGGRVLGDQMPKYLNTSDTPAFKKSRNLFALNFAKASCANQMILCEGYMDVIALHAAGFSNAVATLGTAINSDHARIIQKYTKLVIIAYDSDEAGKRASEKAILQLGEVGVEAKVLKMDGAKDPDEYIQKFGKERFGNLLTESRSLFDHRLEDALSRHDVSVPAEKIKALKELSEFIAGVSSHAEREVYISQTSQKLEIPAVSIKNDVEGSIKKKIKTAKKSQLDHLHRETLGSGDRINPDLTKYPKAASLEETIIGLTIIYSEYIQTARALKFGSGDFVTDFNKRVYSAVETVYNDLGKFDIAFIQDEFSADEISRIMKMVSRRYSLTNNGEDIFKDSVQKLLEEGERIKGSGGVDDIMNILSRKKT